MKKLLVFSTFVLGTAPTLLSADFLSDFAHRAKWQLSGGKGDWQRDALSGEMCLTVNGTGEEHESNYWSCTFPFQAQNIYKISFRVRVSSGTTNGSIIAGANFANFDLSAPTDWAQKEIILTAPDNTDGAYLRLGQWQVQGTVWFRDVQVVSVQPIYATDGDYELGTGERLSKDEYRADLDFHDGNCNATRCLAEHQCYFNTNRWDLHAGDFVVYRHLLAQGRREQKSAEVTVNIGYYERGNCVVEVSGDRQRWQHVGTLSKKGQNTFLLPRNFFPANQIFVRLRAEGLMGRMQVNRYQYRAKVAESLPEFVGQTHFLEVMQQPEDLAVQVQSLGVAQHGRSQPTTIKLSNRGKSRESYQVTVETNGKSVQKSVSVDAGSAATVQLPSAPTDATAQRKKIIITAEGSSQPHYAARTEVAIPYLQWSDYGNLIGTSGDMTLWWTDGTRKVSQDRPAPTAPVQRMIVLSAAQNEYEPVQLVLTAKKDVERINLKVTPLRNSAGESIPASEIELLLVDYVPIEHTTDDLGSVGLWPDPLPLIKASFSLRKNKNQPIWILVHVPATAKSGDYLGGIEVEGGARKQSVPIRLHVWDFDLPTKSHLQSAFGFSPDLVKTYHHLTDADNVKDVVDKYFQSFSKHRISPYDPFVFHPIRASFDVKNLVATLDFSEFDAAASRYLNDFGFTSFLLPIQGMASGTFHSSSYGELNGLRQGSREYRQLMTNYLSQLQKHLEQKGWLDEAYIYWFDEPDKKDYGFVKENMDLIHKAAPKLVRMLTEQPEPELYGYVDLWCPISNSFDFDLARQRKSKGERLWWYICTGPKAPYCGLFIDHHAVDLRTWIWQSWKYGLDGILIWQTNYWTSDAAYPSPKKQNPYADPMSYVSGYGYKPGEVGYWGNGDGRFIYPPKTVFANVDKCFEGPVSSLRWEMLREGMEDYEYFWLLRDLTQKVLSKDGETPLVLEAKMLLEVPETVSKSLTEFSKTPEPMYAHRTKMAEIIEKLQKRLQTN